MWEAIAIALVIAFLTDMFSWWIDSAFMEDKSCKQP
jgi:hypothetical protein